MSTDAPGVPDSSSNTFEADVMLTVKGRYPTQRSIREALLRVIHVHYGVSLDYYRKHPATSLTLILQAFQKSVPSLFSDPDKVVRLFQEILRKSHSDQPDREDAQVSLADMCDSLIEHVRWSPIPAEEMELLKALTPDVAVAAYVGQPDVILNYRTE